MLQGIEDITDVTIHCSATRYGVENDIDDIEEWHAPRHFPSYKDGDRVMHVGYHLIILVDGTLQFARPFTSVGAHVKGQNFGNVGICMIGGLGKSGRPKEDGFLNQQYDCLYETLWSMRAPQHPLYLPNLVRIKGHRDHSPDMNGDGLITREEWLKDCPCFDVDTFLVRNGLAQYKVPSYVDEDKLLNLRR